MKNKLTDIPKAELINYVINITKYEDEILFFFPSRNEIIEYCETMGLSVIECSLYMCEIIDKFIIDLVIPIIEKFRENDYKYSLAKLLLYYDQEISKNEFVKDIFAYNAKVFSAKEFKEIYKVFLQKDYLLEFKTTFLECYDIYKEQDKEIIEEKRRVIEASNITINKITNTTNIKNVFNIRNSESSDEKIHIVRKTLKAKVLLDELKRIYNEIKTKYIDCDLELFLACFGYETDNKTDYIIWKENKAQFEIFIDELVGLEKNSKNNQMGLPRNKINMWFRDSHNQEIKPQKKLSCGKNKYKIYNIIHPK